MNIQSNFPLLASKAELFEAMGLGPVWVLKESPATHANLPRQDVLYAGACPAELVVVGDVSTAPEQLAGSPFVNEPGQLLDRMLAAIGVGRAKNVFVCNAPFDRRSEQKAMTHEPLFVLAPQWCELVENTQARLLLLTGENAAHAVLAVNEPLDDLRTRVHAVKLGACAFKAIVTYHPSHLISNPQDKAKAWDDCLLVRKTLLKK